jgi:hypothetical protein
MNAGAHGGRPRLFDTAGLLRYGATRGAIYLLQMVFGCTNSVFSIFLSTNFLLSNEEEFAKVVIPSPEEIEVHKQKILGNFPDPDGFGKSWMGIKYPFRSQVMN